MSGQTLDALLTSGDPERIALRAPEDGASMSTGELTDSIERLALQLVGAGVRRGDRVVLALPNGPEFVQLLLAVTTVGAAAAPLNPAYTTDEFAFYIGDLSPTIVIAPAGEAADARRAAAGLAVVDVDLESAPPTLTREGTELVPASSFEPAAAEDVALLLHTSGTTSRPKQVPLMHRNLTASARAVAAHYRLSSEDVSFAAMPLFHVHGLVASVFAQLSAGGSVIAPRRLTASHFWSALQAHGVTWFSGSPTVLTMLLDRQPREGIAPSLRFTRTCSAPLNARLAERLESTFEVPVVQAYGMTEASHQIASNPLPPQARDPQSVGIATGTRIATVGGAGHELPPGEAGEVVISGPGVMAGYLNNPDANAASFIDGQLRTGDLGVIDGNGCLRLVGRIKELINRGGEKISPYEVEDVLREHSAVADVACFAIPDTKYGEAVGAVVVLTQDAGIGELRDFCRERLASFKVPRELRAVDALPKTATGKVQRSKLAESFT